MIDLAGQRFGRLTAVRFAERRHGKPYWLCQCDCGGETVSESYELRSGHSASCGCVRREKVAALKLRHGLTRHDAMHPLYSVWKGMRKRCEYPKCESWPNYGGRGIRVCERWQRLENFVADMGPRPPCTTLDRVDNDGNYEPGNCRWATRKEQAANKRPRRREERV